MVPLANGVPIKKIFSGNLFVPGRPVHNFALVVHRWHLYLYYIHIRIRIDFVLYVCVNIFLKNGTSSFELCCNRPQILW
jgi:hypothetical protein